MAGAGWRRFLGAGVIAGCLQHPGRGAQSAAMAIGEPQGLGGGRGGVQGLCTCHSPAEPWEGVSAPLPPPARGWTEHSSIPGCSLHARGAHRAWPGGGVSGGTRHLPDLQAALCAICSRLDRGPADGCIPASVCPPQRGLSRLRRHLPGDVPAPRDLAPSAKRVEPVTWYRSRALTPGGTCKRAPVRVQPRPM